MAPLSIWFVMLVDGDGLGAGEEFFIALTVIEDGVGLVDPPR